MARILSLATLVFCALALVACGSKPATKKRVTSTAAYGPKFADLDPVDWQYVTPWRYPVHGLDVSKFQGIIDWRQAKRAGIKFAFIKATEGGDHLDSLFYQNWLGAGRAGIPRAAYHFYYFCRPAYQQAQWFIRNVPKTRGALPPVLDMEWNHLSPTCKYRPPAGQVRREIVEFMSILTQHYGQRPIIYTSIDFYRDNELSRLQGYEYWLRSVTKHPHFTYPGQPWTFWQYTGTGRVPGVPTKTDINVFTGSAETWEKWVRARRL